MYFSYREIKTWPVRYRSVVSYILHRTNHKTKSIKTFYDLSIYISKPLKRDII